ncbi:sensor histidine kinase [Sphingomonas alpina]|uniref:Histidine kinase n=2 Tax=Sphingomonas alpina TaxID=653931 RepID=A0A7H0LM32_9SPHN|nr:histidine kinase [Sphingomonas alpina]QNQ10735.1 histidine kinase [Sphingomonas alpina]
MDADGHSALHDNADSRIELRRMTWQLGAVYWFSVFLITSLLWHFVGVDAWTSAPAKLVWIGASVAITFAISALLLRWRDVPFLHKAILCFALTLLCAPFSASIDFLLASWYLWPQKPSFAPRDFVYSLIENSSFFFGWACLYVAMLYSHEVRQQERRLAAIREEALAAQMRALRYQINPHFLFNTFNSVAALIEEGMPNEAKRMVVVLSEFLRTTLTLDPFSDVRLDREIALQQDYLAIERERFSDRLNFAFDIPAELSRALVPSLILQPLIENAIKHGVGQARAPIVVRIDARAVEQRLILTVVNDVAPDHDMTDTSSSTGIGLANVSDRLSARFGNRGRCTAGHDGKGAWEARIEMPLRYE